MIAIGQGTTVEEGSGHVHITTMEAQQQTGHLLLIGCGVDLVIQSKWEQEGKHAGLLSERTSADRSIETNQPLTKELPDELDQAGQPQHHTPVSPFWYPHSAWPSLSQA